MLTLATAGDGYLNFMGNEFGHPEWIDFPREGNGWSYAHARRLWSISDRGDLHYKALREFDKAMIHLFAGEKLLSKGHFCTCCDNTSKVLAFTRGDYLFAFNFNPEHSFADYATVAPEGTWQVALDSDAAVFDGFCRVDDSVCHTTLTNRKGEQLLRLYLPSRTVIVLKRLG